MRTNTPHESLSKELAKQVVANTTKVLDGMKEDWKERALKAEANNVVLLEDRLALLQILRISDCETAEHFRIAWAKLEAVAEAARDLLRTLREENINVYSDLDEALAALEQPSEAKVEDGNE